MSLSTAGSADSHVIDYRPDVDGLRAVAVMSVINFHLFRDALPGGYLGVDIFFVISGYLITLVIWREIQAGQFSIATFYNRRIRRILPALLLVLTIVTVACTLILLPPALVSFGRSLASTLFFFANIHFLRDAQDYFSRAAEFKPLLHMWSLGVEEQFYIIFPVVLVLMARFWKQKALAVVVALTLGSMGSDVMASWLGGSQLAFYLLPTRAWELGLGAIVAMAPRCRNTYRTLWPSVALGGATLVVWSLVHPVEGVAGVPAALPAVAGAGLLILAGQHQSSGVHSFLRLRPVVFVGLISYSLYLWHWPIIVLSRYYLVRELKPLEVAVAIVLMFACAIASWHFIERPFRSKLMPIRKVHLVAGSGVGLLAVAAAAIVLSGGLPSRFPEAPRLLSEAIGDNFRCPLKDYIRINGSDACTMHLPSHDPEVAEVVLLGNSHAKMYAPVLGSILEQQGRLGLVMWSGTCLPTPVANTSLDCVTAADRNLDNLLRLQAVHTVVIGLTWWHADDGLIDPAGRVLDNRENRALVAGIDDLIERLKRAGKTVVLVGPLAQPGYEVASVVSRQLVFGHPVDRPTWYSAEAFLQRFGHAIDHFEARGGIGFARPDLVQCQSGRCDYIRDGRALFADTNHITVPWSFELRNEFERALKASGEDAQYFR